MRNYNNELKLKLNQYISRQNHQQDSKVFLKGIISQNSQNGNRLRNQIQDMQAQQKIMTHMIRQDLEKQLLQEKIKKRQLQEEKELLMVREIIQREIQNNSNINNDRKLVQKDVQKETQSIQQINTQPLALFERSLTQSELQTRNFINNMYSLPTRPIQLKLYNNQSKNSSNTDNTCKLSNNQKAQHRSYDASSKLSKQQLESDISDEVQLISQQQQAAMISNKKLEMYYHHCPTHIKRVKFQDEEDLELKHLTKEKVRVELTFVKQQELNNSISVTKHNESIQNNSDTRASQQSIKQQTQKVEQVQSKGIIKLQQVLNEDVEQKSGKLPKILSQSPHSSNVFKQQDFHEKQILQQHNKDLQQPKAEFSINNSQKANHNLPENIAKYLSGENQQDVTTQEISKLQELKQQPNTELGLDELQKREDELKRLLDKELQEIKNIRLNDFFESTSNEANASQKQTSNLGRLWEEQWNELHGNDEDFINIFILQHKTEDMIQQYEKKEQELEKNNMSVAKATIVAEKTEKQLINQTQDEVKIQRNEQPHQEQSIQKMQNIQQVTQQDDRIEVLDIQKQHETKQNEIQDISFDARAKEYSEKIRQYNIEIQQQEEQHKVQLKMQQQQLELEYHQQLQLQQQQHQQQLKRQYEEYEQQQKELQSQHQQLLLLQQQLQQQQLLLQQSQQQQQHQQQQQQEAQEQYKQQLIQLQQEEQQRQIQIQQQQKEKEYQMQQKILKQERQLQLLQQQKEQYEHQQQLLESQQQQQQSQKQEQEQNTLFKYISNNSEGQNINFPTDSQPDFDTDSQIDDTIHVPQNNKEPSEQQQHQDKQQIKKTNMINLGQITAESQEQSAQQDTADTSLQQQQQEQSYQIVQQTSNQEATNNEVVLEQNAETNKQSQNVENIKLQQTKHRINRQFRKQQQVQILQTTQQSNKTDQSDVEVDQLSILSNQSEVISYHQSTEENTSQQTKQQIQSDLNAQQQTTIISKTVSTQAAQPDNSNQIVQEHGDAYQIQQTDLNIQMQDETIQTLNNFIVTTEEMQTQTDQLIQQINNNNNEAGEKPSNSSQTQISSEKNKQIYSNDSSSELKVSILQTKKDEQHLHIQENELYVKKSAQSPVIKKPELLIQDLNTKSQVKKKLENEIKYNLYDAQAVGNQVLKISYLSPGKAKVECVTVQDLSEQNILKSNAKTSKQDQKEEQISVQMAKYFSPQNYMNKKDQNQTSFFIQELSPSQILQQRSRLKYSKSGSDIIDYKEITNLQSSVINRPQTIKNAPIPNEMDIQLNNHKNQQIQQVYHIETGSISAIDSINNISYSEQLQANRESLSESIHKIEKTQQLKASIFDPTIQRSPKVQTIKQQYFENEPNDYQMHFERSNTPINNILLFKRQRHAQQPFNQHINGAGANKSVFSNKSQVAYEYHVSTTSQIDQDNCHYSQSNSDILNSKYGIFNSSKAELQVFMEASSAGK